MLPKEGNKVKFLAHNEDQRKFGSHSKTENILVPGGIYEVESVDIHSWNTDVYLVGIKGEFNSVQFEIVE